MKNTHQKMEPVQMSPDQHVEAEPSFWIPPQQKQEPTLPRNLVICIFIAFLAGLLLGKIMHPTVLTLKP